MATTTKPRADALRNRARILAAAADVFAEQGPEAALDDIAKRAEIGNATVYRHFADKNVLLHEVVLAALTRTADEAERAAHEEPDPYAALTAFVHTIADQRIAILCPLLVGPRAAAMDAQKQRVINAVGTLVRAAREAGQLRPDVTPADLLMALGQLTRPPAGSTWATTEPFAHRNLQIYLDGLHVHPR